MQRQARVPSRQALENDGPHGFDGESPLCGKFTEVVPDCSGVALHAPTFLSARSFRYYHLPQQIVPCTIYKRGKAESSELGLSSMSRSIRVTGEDANNEYGILLANDEGKWLFARLNEEGKEGTFSENFSGPLIALRSLSEQGWEVVNAYSAEKKPGFNGDRFLLRKQLPKPKKKARIGIR